MKVFFIYREQINSRHYYCLVCERDNNLIGVLNLRFEGQLHHSECIAEIMGFAVDSVDRKTVLIKKILLYLFQELEKNKLEK